MTARILRLGTRRSPLAMVQAEAARAAIVAAVPQLEVELVGLDSVADLDERPLHEFAERGVFASQLEAALLSGAIDAAVHSSKDLRLTLPPELPIVAFLPREDPRDALCATRARTLAELPNGARVATGAVRRQAALRALRPDLEPVPIRGNIQTRLARTAEHGYDACMLAMAGLRRSGLAARASIVLDVHECVPEAGQGAVALQVAAGSWAAKLDWSAIADAPTHRTVDVERAAAALLGGGCTAPIGVHVVGDVGEDALAYLFAASPDGRESVTGSCTVRGDAPVAEQAAAIVALAGELGALRWSDATRETVR